MFKLIWFLRLRHSSGHVELGTEGYCSKFVRKGEIYCCFLSWPQLMMCPDLIQERRIGCSNFKYKISIKLILFFATYSFYGKADGHECICDFSMIKRIIILNLDIFILNALCEWLNCIFRTSDLTSKSHVKVIWWCKSSIHGHVDRVALWCEKCICYYILLPVTSSCATVGLSVCQLLTTYLIKWSGQSHFERTFKHLPGHSVCEWELPFLFFISTNSN